MIIPESLKNILSEDEAALIKEEFDRQVDKKVEAHIKEYEDEVCESIHSLMEQVNTTHKLKLAQVLESVENKYNKVVESISTRYHKALKHGAERFKNDLALRVERIVQEQVRGSIDAKTINEAARNKTAFIVLESLRKQLAVDSALMEGVVAQPMEDARRKLKESVSIIRKLKNDRAKLREEKQILGEQLEGANAALLLESKVANLPDDTANYMRRILKDQPINVINENFDYALKLYDNKEASHRASLRSDAAKARKTQFGDANRRALVTESVAPEASTDDMISLTLSALDK